MIGNAALRSSRIWWRGFRRGHKSVYRRHPGWAMVGMWVLTILLFGASIGVTWTAVDLALKNVSGKAIEKTTIGKWAAWWKVMEPVKHDRR